MGAKTAKEIRGVEYDWIACDSKDHLALLSTAGGGYAPEEFLRNTDLHDAAIDAILALPASTSALFAPILEPGRVNIWRLVAERGLFAFDADVHGGSYRGCRASGANNSSANASERERRASGDGVQESTVRRARYHSERIS